MRERSGSLLMRLLDCVDKEHLRKWAAEVVRRADKRINFGGFHVYMSLKDFLILKAHYGLAPEYVYDSRARRLVFGRALRNLIMGETDAAFWDAFVQRCIVTNGALDESVDHFGFRYDEALAEECQTYWSAKCAVSVLFGKKTGRLVLEE